MAEGLLKDMKGEDIRVESAGIFAIDGEGANPEAIETMKEMGIDISTHKAKRLTLPIIGNADIIFAMTKNHRDAILSIDPMAADKTYTLSEYGAKFDRRYKNMDIDDPYGRPIEAYRQSAQDIKAILEIIADKI